MKEKTEIDMDKIDRLVDGLAAKTRGAEYERIVDDRIGKTLQEAVDTIPEYEIINVGDRGGSSFVFCGYRKDYEKYIDEISEIQHERMLKSAEKRLLGCDMVLGDSINAYILQLGKRESKENDVRALQNIIASAAKTCKTALAAKEYADDMPTLRERKVLEIYQKIESGEGIVILVEGKENGEFWSKSEFDQKIHKKEGRITRKC